MHVCINELVQDWFRRWLVAFFGHLSEPAPKSRISCVKNVNSLGPSDAYLRQWLTTISSDNGLSPGRRQAIIWTNTGILLIRILGSNFSEILIEIHTFSIQEHAFENVVCEMASILYRPHCVKQTRLQRWGSGVGIPGFLFVKWAVRLTFSNLWRSKLVQKYSRIINTLGPWDGLIQQTLSNAFYSKNIYICKSYVYSNLTAVCLNDSVDYIKSALVWVMTGRRTGDKPLPEPMMSHFIDSGFNLPMTMSWRKCFPRDMPFVKGIYRSPMNSPHIKSQWRGIWCFLWC